MFYHPRMSFCCFNLLFQISIWTVMNLFCVSYLFWVGVAFSNSWELVSLTGAKWKAASPITTHTPHTWHQCLQSPESSNTAIIRHIFRNRMPLFGTILLKLHTVWSLCSVGCAPSYSFHLLMSLFILHYAGPIRFVTVIHSAKLCPLPSSITISADSFFSSLLLSPFRCWPW